MNIFQSAVDNWPEDEAWQIAQDWKEQDPNDYTHQEWYSKISNDCTRMEKFFMEESDGPELVKRFRAEILKRLDLPANFFLT